MKKTLLAIAAAIAALLVPAAAPAQGPRDLVQAALLQSLPQLERCVGGRALYTAVRLRVRAGETARLVRIIGVSDPRARACLKGVMEAMRFDERAGAMPSDVVLPLEFGVVWSRGAPTAVR